MSIILRDDDRRRAAAFLRYANPAEPNIDGLNGVLREAHDRGRGTPLTLAIAAIAYSISGLSTDAGQSGLERLALAYYESEHQNTEGDQA